MRAGVSTAHLSPTGAGRAAHGRSWPSTSAVTKRDDSPGLSAVTGLLGRLAVVRLRS